MWRLPFVVVIFLCGCATYQDKVATSRQQVQQGEFDLALPSLKKLSENPSDDQLVYLLDYASSLQAAGQYDESNQIFQKAEKLIDEIDYHSISRITGSLLLSEEIKQYKGDTFEKIFINAQLALNYLALGKVDDALVEARRINQKFSKYRAESDADYRKNPFSLYLSAVLWEATGQYDDAAIAYTDAYQIDPDMPGIIDDLLRSTKKARRWSEYKKWAQTFGVSVGPENPDKPQIKKKPQQGTLIIIVQKGWGPRKYPSYEDQRFPALRRVEYSEENPIVDISHDREDGAANHLEIKRVYDVTQAAIDTLRADQASLFARRVGGLVVKYAVAEEVRKKDELLGLAAWILMNVADRADVRQWSFLPDGVYLGRFELFPGEYFASLGSTVDKKQIKIEAGKTNFLILRSY